MTNTRDYVTGVNEAKFSLINASDSPNQNLSPASVAEVSDIPMPHRCPRHQCLRNLVGEINVLSVKILTYSR